MKKGFFFLFISMLSIVLTACGGQIGSNSYSQPASSGKQVDSKTSGDVVTTIELLKNEKVGDYLADGKGMTLYYYTKDEPGVSTCTAGCLQAWPAFYGDVNHLNLPAGFNKADFSTLKRDDTGKPQITYKGYPLYYYVPDQQKGEVNGQGVGGVWYIVNTKTALKKSQVKTPSSSTTTQDNNNGY